MKAPKGLREAGTAVWNSIYEGLPDNWELDEREAAVLELACRQADVVADLEAAVTDGVMAKGSTGQVVVHPAIIEARQGRLAINRLLGQIVLPAAEKSGGETSGQRAWSPCRSGQMDPKPQAGGSSWRGVSSKRTSTSPSARTVGRSNGAWNGME